MKVTRKSTITGVVRTLDLPITEEQMQAFLTGKLSARRFSKSACCRPRIYLDGRHGRRMERLCHRSG